MSDKKDFYILLEDEHTSDEYYEHALKVLLLADVFKEFRNLFLEFYALDPCDYFSSPGFS